LVAVKILVADLLDEGRDIDSDRAAVHAGLLGAHKATFGLEQRLLVTVAVRNFVEVSNPLARGLFGYRGALLRDRADGFLLGHGP